MPAIRGQRLRRLPDLKMEPESPAEAGSYPFGLGTSRTRQIFTANRSATSRWRGIASTVPVMELAHNECAPPSRFK